MKPHSPDYIQHYKHGAFPGVVDAWVENGRYFQQLHSGMINSLQDQLQDALIARGYQAGKEASLQIFAGREPDLYVEQTVPSDVQLAQWDYDAAATAVAVEPGTPVAIPDADFEALHIHDMQTGQLITVIEIISPRNKTYLPEMTLYQIQRSTLFLARGVHVVEIDLTRSIKHLLQHPLIQHTAYHTAIFLPNHLPRVVVYDVLQPIKPFALPLRNEVLPVNLQHAYDTAYQRGALAGLILRETDYALEELPFPSLLTEVQQHTLMQSVQAWKTRLAELA
jgi:hypothetical protein